MSDILRIFLIGLLVFQIILIINTVKRKKFSIKYASFWIFLILMMVIIVIFPGIVFKISEFFGFEKTSNMIFLLGFFFLFYIIFILTTSISVQNDKIKLLIQEISMLKERVDNDGKKD